MKRFFSRAYGVLAIIAVLGFFAPVFSPSSVAYAQQPTATSSTEDIFKTPCDPIDIFSPSSIINLPCIFGYSLMLGLIEIISAITALIAMLLDYSVYFFILKITDYFSTNGSQESIFVLWKTVRDVCNILAFFSAAYLGLRRIMGLDGDTFKKTIAKLMLFAILTNFSFPISKFLIDISNVVTLQMYGGITKFTFIRVEPITNLDAYFGSVRENRGPVSGGISEAIMEKVSISYLLSAYIEGNKDSNGNQMVGGYTSFSMMGIVILYLLFSMAVFVYGAVMILIRTAMLLLSVVLSPLMFIGGLVPALSNVHDWWRKNFTGQLVFPPIFMTMLYIAFILLQSALDITRNVGGETNFFKEITIGSLAIVTLLVSVYLAHKFSGSVGKFVGGALGGAALVATTGGTGLLARGAIGRAGVALQRANWVERGQGSKNALARNFSRFVDYTGRSMENYRVRGKSYRDVVQQKKIATRDRYGDLVDGKELKDARTSGEVNTARARAGQRRMQLNNAANAEREAQRQNNIDEASEVFGKNNGLTGTEAVTGAALILTPEQQAQKAEEEMLKRWQDGEGKPMYDALQNAEGDFERARTTARQAQGTWEVQRTAENRRTYNDAQREQMRASSSVTRLRRENEKAYAEWKKGQVSSELQTEKPAAAASGNGPVMGGNFSQTGEAWRRAYAPTVNGQPLSETTLQATAATQTASKLRGIRNNAAAGFNQTSVAKAEEIAERQSVAITEAEKLQKEWDRKMNLIGQTDPVTGQPVTAESLRNEYTAKIAEAKVKEDQQLNVGGGSVADVARFQAQQPTTQTEKPRLRYNDQTGVWEPSSAPQNTSSQPSNNAQAAPQVISRAEQVTNQANNSKQASQLTSEGQQTQVNNRQPAPQMISRTEQAVPQTNRAADQDSTTQSADDTKKKL